MPPSRRASAFQFTQSQWAEWADKRDRDAERIAKQYRADARAVRKMLVESGCKCDPVIVTRRKGESPDTETPLLTHTFDCTR